MTTVSPASKSKGRFLVSDYARGIAIILVVVGHVIRGLVEAEIITMDQHWAWIFQSAKNSFHMPLFFFLSGLFFLRATQKTFPQFMTKRLANIAYPYVLWISIQWFTRFIMDQYTNNDSGSYWETLFGAPYGYWFLVVLFFVHIATYLLISMGLKKSTLIGAGVIAFLLYPFVRELAMPYVVARSFEMFLYFVLGMYSRDLVETVFGQRRTLLFWVTGVAVLGFLFALAAAVVADRSIDCCNIYNTLHSSEVSDPQFWELWFSFLPAYAGGVAILAITSNLSRIRIGWLEYIGQMSLEIYVVHIIAASGVRIVLQKFLGIENVAVHFIVGVLAGVLFPLLVVWFFDKINFQYGFRFPMRKRTPEPVTPVTSG